MASRPIRLAIHSPEALRRRGRHAVAFLARALVALIVGGAAVLDARSFRDTSDVDPDTPAFLWVIATVVFSHFGSLGYKMSRRNAVRKHLGLSPSEHAHLMDRLDPRTGTASVA